MKALYRCHGSLEVQAKARAHRKWTIWRALNDQLHWSDEMTHVGANEDEWVHTGNSLNWDAPQGLVCLL